MTSPRLRLDRALELLPETEALAPLRRAVVAHSVADEAQAWAGGQRYATLSRRFTDPELLAAAIPELVKRESARIEAVFSEVVAAMRALAAGDAAAAALAYVRAGEVEEEAGNLAAARAHFERAADIGRSARDRRPEGLAHRRVGRVARAQGDLTLSLERYRLGYSIAEAQRDVDGMVTGCQGMGNVLVEMARWDEAASWYQRGLAALDETPPGRHLWQLESNLSLVERRAGRLEESERWLERARSTANDVGDESADVYLLNAEGLLLVARGDLPGADDAYRTALSRARSAVERARVMVNLAELLLLQRRSREAETLLRELEAVTIEHGLIATLPYVYRGLGNVARLELDAEGFLFFEQALKRCRADGLPRFEQALTQLEYAEFELTVGLAESALARLDEARAIFATLGSGVELERTQVLRAQIEQALKTTHDKQGD